jgi:hypothetical protein
MKLGVVVGITIALAAGGCSETAEGGSEGGVDVGDVEVGRVDLAGADDVGVDEATPVYVTVAGHIEPGRRYADCATYPRFRDGLLRFMDLMRDEDIPFNLQVDYTFLVGTRECETDSMRRETGGQTLFDYLSLNYLFELDPHQEGGQDAPDAENPDTYADIHAVGSEVSSSITDTVGGFVWEDAGQLADFRAGVDGALVPGARWTPDLLTLAVSFMHREGDFDRDDRTSGVWRPSAAGDAFWTDDPSGSLAYVGPGLHHSAWGPRGCDFESPADYARVLLRYMDEGRLPTGRIYTATLAVPQSVIFNVERHAEVVEKLDAADDLVAEGRLIYATYTGVASIWRDTYASEPNIVRFSEIDPSDYTCDGR